MAKYYGKIGYSVTEETRPGIWEKRNIERFYYGDVIRNTRRLESGNDINSDVNVNNTISIVADPYAYNNFFAMQYIEWMGVLWIVTNVEVQRPRLLLTIGGVYNGNGNKSSTSPCNP